MEPSPTSDDSSVPAVRVSVSIESTTAPALISPVVGKTCSVDDSLMTTLSVLSASTASTDAVFTVVAVAATVLLDSGEAVELWLVSDTSGSGSGSSSGSGSTSGFGSGSGRSSNSGLESSSSSGFEGSSMRPVLESPSAPFPIVSEATLNAGILGQLPSQLAKTVDDSGWSGVLLTSVVVVDVEVVVVVVEVVVVVVVVGTVVVVVETVVVVVVEMVVVVDNSLPSLSSSSGMR